MSRPKSDSFTSQPSLSNSSVQIDGLRLGGTGEEKPPRTERRVCLLFSWSATCNLEEERIGDLKIILRGLYPLIKILRT